MDVRTSPKEGLQVLVTVEEDSLLRAGLDGLVKDPVFKRPDGETQMVDPEVASAFKTELDDHYLPWSAARKGGYSSVIGNLTTDEATLVLASYAKSAETNSDLASAPGNVDPGYSQRASVAAAAVAMLSQTVEL